MHDPVERLTRILDGTYEPERDPSEHPNAASLYGGIAGAHLAVPEFVMCEGLIVRETFAHIMAPYILAFAKPTKPRTPHPGPWKAANGGINFDIFIEVALAKGTRPTGLDRINTLWWVLALLRLVSGAPLRMPVVSNTRFSMIPSKQAEPNFWTIEMPLSQLRLVPGAAGEISLEHLAWTRNVLIDGAQLLDDPSFNRAFQTYDGVAWAHSTSAAIMLAWAAIEALFRPGRNQITKRLASAIAAYFHEPGPERDKAFQQIALLYEARGSSAHDARIPEGKQLVDSYDLARRAMIKSLDEGRPPRLDDLLRKWKERR